MQASYHTLNAPTARPPKEDLRRVSHRLYGHVPVAAPYSVGQCVEALATIDEAQEKAQRPILVGGTGLYFRSLIEGLADIPDIPDNVRDGLRAARQ